MKYTLLASAPDLNGIKGCITDYYYGSSITLTLIETTKREARIYSVSTGKGLCEGKRVIIKQNKRVRFEMETT